MWPFQRRRSEARPEPVRYEPGRGEWRQLPPLQRVVGDQWLVNPADSLTSHLVSWRDPSYLAPLGHAVPPDGPSGAIEPAPVTVEPRQVRAEPAQVRSKPRQIGLQRQADPVRFDAASPAGPSTPVQTMRSDPVAEPAPVQRAFESEPTGPESVEDRPLLGADSGPALSAPSEPVFDTRVETPAPELPMRSEPPTVSRSAQPAPDPAPSLQRAEAPRAPVQPVTPPFALQRKLIGEQSLPAPIGGDPAVSGPPTPLHSAPVVASLLASTDPPERRALPVVAAPRSSVQAGASPSSPAVAVQREAESPEETAPLIGELGLAAPIMGDAAAETPPMVQPTTELPMVSPTSPQSLPPVAPLIADRPGPEPSAESHNRRLGLGAPLTGLPGGPSVQRIGNGSRPSTPVQRLDSGGTPPPAVFQRLVAPQSPPNSVSQSPNLPNPPAPTTRPLPPQVMVMRTASSDPAIPVASRAIDEPGPVYVPADPIPEAPLLGLRPMDAEFTADAVPQDRTVSGDAHAPESRSSAPDAPSVQRSPWSHMPKPMQRQTAFEAPRSSAAPASPSSADLPAAPPSSQAAVPQQLASHASPSWAPVAQRFNAPSPMPVAAAPVAVAPEPAALVVPEAPQPQPVQHVIQRVATPAPQEAAQAEETAAVATAGAPAAADPGALLALLYEPLVRRLRADLRVDRERRGRLTDL